MKPKRGISLLLAVAALLVTACSALQLTTPRPATATPEPPTPTPRRPTPTPEPPTPTPQSGPTRIRFEPGATSATLAGHIERNAIDRYVLRALAGQTMEVHLISPSNGGLLGIQEADGTILKPHTDGASDWQGALPSTQDYFIEVISGGSETDYVLTVTIPPIEPTPATPEWNLYRNEEFGVEVAYPSGFFIDIPCQPAAVMGNVIVSFRLADTRYYSGTNLSKACVIVGASQSQEALSSCLEPQSELEESLGEVEIDSITLYKGSTVEGAAGSIYEQISYRTIHEDTCYEIALFMHSGNVENYPAGTVSEFDREEVLEKLEQIPPTFRFLE